MAVKVKISSWRPYRYKPRPASRSADDGAYVGEGREENSHEERTGRKRQSEKTRGRTEQTARRHSAGRPKICRLPAEGHKQQSVKVGAAKTRRRPFEHSAGLRPEGQSERKTEKPPGHYLTTVQLEAYLLPLKWDGREKACIKYDLPH